VTKIVKSGNGGHFEVTLQKNLTFISFLLHFLIEHSSIDKYAKNPDGLFCFKQFAEF